MTRSWADLFIQKNKLPATKSPTSITPLFPVSSDTSLDAIWGGINYGTKNGGINTYFDYFFSGQDIIIAVDGVEEDIRFKILPIMQVSWNITQQKTPVYGFWSYTLDAVLHGTRIIQGSFTIATKYPNYMTDLISAAASARQTKLGSDNYYYFKGLTEDDANIEKYWNKTLDPALQGSLKNIFSIHPPFSFVIIYGIQNTSLSNTQPSLSDLYNRYRDDDPWLMDVNERLVESDLINQKNRIVIDDIYLQSMDTAYGGDGDVIQETYSFFARDIVIPS